MSDTRKWYQNELFKFCLVCLLTAIFVFILYHFHLRPESKIVDLISQKNGTRSEDKMSTIDSCAAAQFLGDGYCDDDFNIEECNFDFGDCCNPQADRSICSDCICYLQPTDDGKTREKCVTYQSRERPNFVMPWIFTVNFRIHSEIVILKVKKDIDYLKNWKIFLEPFNAYLQTNAKEIYPCD